MNIERLHCFQRLALFFLILFLPLNSIPKRFAIPGIGGDLSNYFFILGMGLLIYEYFKFGFTINRKVKFFFCTYIIWQLLCLIHGLYFYEYNELLTLNQIPRLEVILNKLASYGLVIQELTAIKSWLFLRFSKNILLLNNIVFLVCFYIWHLYKDDFDSAFSDVRRAVICLVLLMGSYSFIELLWLKFNLPFARAFLETVNQLLYDVVIVHGWWPPLLWNGQLRSISREPSFFGIISVMCLPFVWSYMFRKEIKKIALLGALYFTFMIAATNARTAIVLTIGELALLIGINVFVRQAEFLKKTLLVMVITILAFGFNLIDLKGMLNSSDVGKVKSASNYVKHNITSVTDTKSRSNNARLANLVANINTIIEYPIMGIGTGLKDAYIDRNLPEFAYNNYEVRNWSRYMRNEGVLKSGGYPDLNKYADVAVQNGLIGLLLYLSVVGHLVINLIKKYKFILNDYRAVMLVIAMLGLLAAGLSNAGFVLCNGIIWGLLYCKLEETRNMQSL